MIVMMMMMVMVKMMMATMMMMIPMTEEGKRLARNSCVEVKSTLLPDLSVTLVINERYYREDNDNDNDLSVTLVIVVNGHQCLHDFHHRRH